MRKVSEAPGCKWRARADGERVPYWCARADLVKQGYRPRTVRLHYDPADPQSADAIAARCRVLQAEMLQWAAGRRDGQRPFDGTMRALVALYETDENSPYRDLRQNTQRTYSKHMRILMASVGDRRLDGVTGADVRRWYKNLAAPTDEGGRERISYAYLMISILKAVVSYGASLGGQIGRSCSELRAQMTAARFSNGGPRSTRMTYEQVTAFRAQAHALGQPSMALGVTLQYELAFRQRDVIGEWIDDEAGTDGIRVGKRVWRDGLTWSHIDAEGVLRKMVSKTRFTSAREAVHRVSDYPDLAAELAMVPAERRVGPLVINPLRGLPYTGEQYRKAFRKIARKAGIPDEVWNMDARAGAVTEAYETGATTEGAMALATHTQVSTSRRYMRETIEQTSRVARLRVDSRKREQ